MKTPTDPKDIKAIRDMLTGFRTQICATGDLLSEPFKTQFNDLKKHYDDTLSSLPPTDQIPAAMEANHHLSCFYSCLASASALASMVSSALDSMVKANGATVQTALNSAVSAEIDKQVAAGTIFKSEAIPVKVTEALDAKVKAGDLVPKEASTQLCSAAKELGLKEGEQKVRDEIAATEARKTLITTRKATLQTCSLPVPDAKLEDVLAGTDDDFKARQETVKARIAALNQKGVALNSESPVGPFLWASDDQWPALEAALVMNLKGGGNLLAVPPTKTGGATGPMIC